MSDIGDPFTTPEKGGSDQKRALQRMSTCCKVGDNNFLQPVAGSFDGLSSEEESEVEDIHCRICWMELDESAIRPCNCKGSLKLIHSHCLKQWIGSRMTRKGNSTTECFWWKSIQCELCKTNFSAKVMAEH